MTYRSQRPCPERPVCPVTLLSESQRETLTALAKPGTRLYVPLGHKGGHRAGQDKRYCHMATAEQGGGALQGGVRRVSGRTVEVLLKYLAIEGHSALGGGYVAFVLSEEGALAVRIMMPPGERDPQGWKRRRVQRPQSLNDLSPHSCREAS